MKHAVATPGAPAAIGPYSQGIRAGGMVFVSGQLPLDVKTGAFPEDVKGQTKCSILNCKAILEAAGLSLANVVKTTVFLKDMDDFAAMNEVYASFFEEPFPARAAVQVARLPRDAMVEIEMIAAE
ncbi:MAG: RidA family protein [Clostridia bacterium]|nr:RidA family protein [Clostridia bacterium]MBQ6000663.1 RidA family protein [Clostridia bacterium]